MRAVHFIPFLLSAVLLAGCGPSVTGKVTDVTGEPLPNSTVTLLGTRHQTFTDETGSFELPAEKGEFRVTVAQSGYVSEEIPVDITSSDEVSLGQVELLKIPSQTGLTLLQGAEFVLMEPGRVYREMYGKRYYPEGKNYCVDKEASEVNEVEAGTVKLFEKNAKGWRAWKLDDEGCAYRIVKDLETFRWKDDYGEQVKHSERRLTTDKAVIEMELPPGEYFISDWFNGQFVEIKDQKYVDEEGNEWNVYSGHYLVAK